MLVRDFFVGKVLDETELGSFQRGLKWVKQSVLIASVDGRPELFLERTSGIGFLTGGVVYLHLPADGVDNILEGRELALRVIRELARKA